MRTIDMARHTTHASSRILATVILDRVSGFLGLLTVLSLALLFGYRVLNEPGIIIIALILLVIILFLSGIIFSGRFFNAIFRHVPFERLKVYLYQIHEATSSFKGRRDILFFAWFLSCIGQAGMPVIYYLIYKSLGAHLSPVFFFILVPVVMVISVIPVSIAGLGVRDTASVVLFGKVGMVAEKAFALSLVNFSFIFCVGILGGLTYVFAISRRRL